MPWINAPSIWGKKEKFHVWENTANSSISTSRCLPEFFKCSLRGFSAYFGACLWKFTYKFTLEHVWTSPWALSSVKDVNLNLSLALKLQLQKSPQKAHSPNILIFFSAYEAGETLSDSLPIDLSTPWKGSSNVGKERRSSQGSGTLAAHPLPLAQQRAGLTSLDCLLDRNRKGFWAVCSLSFLFSFKRLQFLDVSTWMKLPFHEGFWFLGLLLLPSFLQPHFLILTSVY